MQPVILLLMPSDLSVTCFEIFFSLKLIVCSHIILVPIYFSAYFVSIMENIEIFIPFLKQTKIKGIEHILAKHILNTIFHIWNKLQMQDMYFKCSSSWHYNKSMVLWKKLVNHMSH